jgi:glycerol-3-phosphate acyltransferase PlsY
VLRILALVLTSYFMGSIPVAWLVAKAVTGQDLREMGSGNVGVMNTALSVSRGAGLLVFLTEAAKGMLAVFFARRWGGGEVVVGLAVLAAVVGTRWPVWLRGAGGRGNTTAMAALLIISWPTFVGTLALWIVARAITRSSFLATRVTFVLWPLLFGFITQSVWMAVLGAAFSLVFLTTHRRGTDDHLLINKQWSGLWDFLTSPRRQHPPG